LVQGNVIFHQVYRSELLLIRRSTRYSMWLREKLLALQVDNLSIRQQLDLLQDNAYIRCNLEILTKIGIALNRASHEETSTKETNSRYAKESNIAWINIRSYIHLAFPVVWKAICDSNILFESTIKSDHLVLLQDINIRVQSCKKFLEVFKTLVYGGSLRPHFSQDIHIQQLYISLLQSCQISDISGKENTAGQYRITFLQNWIEKLVINSSNSCCTTDNILFSSPKHQLKKQSILVSDTKFLVSEIPKPKARTLSHKNELKSVLSSQTLNTTFSSYIRKPHIQSTKFVGIKIKFDSDSSIASDCTDSSDSSVWKPAFQKRKLSES